MNKDTKGYIQVDDKEHWTLIEMMNKFRDENYTKKLSKKEGNKKVK